MAVIGVVVGPGCDLLLHSTLPSFLREVAVGVVVMLMSKCQICIRQHTLSDVVVVVDLFVGHAIISKRCLSLARKIT